MEEKDRLVLQIINRIKHMDIDALTMLARIVERIQGIDLEMLRKLYIFVIRFTSTE